MKTSRSLAIATGVTLAVAGAVSALFLTVGAGASILDPTGRDSASRDSTTTTTDGTSATTDDLSNVEIYTLDDNGQLVPIDDRLLSESSSASGGSDRGGDGYEEHHRYVDDHGHDDGHDEADDRYEDDDDHGYDEGHDEADDRYEDDHGRHGDDD